MKKSSLEMLRLTSDEVLGRSQMKKITGGARFTCSCSDGSTSWDGNYSTAMQISNAINNECGSAGGSCHAAPQQ
ncbi:MAG: hypothetical protein EA341_11070 [Mongoliibacter sp.]|uniref:hypothetical protein n=1 Tax=Mongoliibacter sp. TaxID=2022438 RepID=UPI0012F00954|nr:hypothetical protein [Mongoliibacter sp.]TVP48261.1 MAG: hypothetical protein EA341_11070 [Mongoliibacter sp.]